jgi:exosortase J
MSSLPVAEARPVASHRLANLSPQQAAGLASILAILGISTVWSTALFLWNLWTTDALKSIGMFIPVVSFVLILRVWRSLNWEMSGSWWGFVILAVTMLAVRLRDQAVLIFVVSPQWSVYIPPHSVVAFAYVAGVVLLFGGARLFRAAIFPIVLIWFVNPIPHIFNVFVDLPLQRASAHVARAFAIALGQPLSPDKLRLMFTPEFGMFIAPGCNGIRGAVTMGFIALIAGYVYRFRWYANAAVVLGAVILGYLFNFVRLCTLVLYYLVALHYPWLQNKAEMGDYIIGACLFLIATFLLFFVIGRLRESPNQIQPVAPISEIPTQPAPRTIYLRLALMSALTIFGCIGVARVIAHDHDPAVVATTLADQTALGKFPTTIGNYTLVRSWNENLLVGVLLFHWAEYAPPGDGPHVSIGISPLLGTHDTLICHSARGEDPLWQNQVTLATAANVPVTFSGSFFNDGATQYFEATTLCNSISCGEFATQRAHLGFVYSHPDPQAVFAQDPIRPIPILVRAETIDTTLAPDLARAEMLTAIQSFVTNVNLNNLTQQYRRR